jgi:hypothetical protein
MNVPTAVILCNHDFRPASDLPSDVWRCVKCAENGYDSLQTQFAPCNGNCRCGGEQ